MTTKEAVGILLGEIGALIEVDRYATADLCGELSHALLRPDRATVEGVLKESDIMRDGPFTAGEGHYVVDPLKESAPWLLSL